MENHWLLLLHGVGNLGEESRSWILSWMMVRRLGTMRVNETKGWKTIAYWYSMECYLGEESRSWILSWMMVRRLGSMRLNRTISKRMEHHWNQEAKFLSWMMVRRLGFMRVNGIVFLMDVKPLLFDNPRSKLWGQESKSWILSLVIDTPWSILYNMLGKSRSWFLSQMTIRRLGKSV